MDSDMIEGLATEAIQALNDGETERVYALLGEIKGHANAMITISTIWELIQEDYESGARPKDLARKYKQYGVTIKEVYNRAHVYQWVSPQKIKRSIKPPPGKKNVFYPTCRGCEKPFEAYSGHAIVCPTCKAFAAHTKAERRLKEARALF